MMPVTSTEKSDCCHVRAMRAVIVSSPALRVAGRSRARSRAKLLTSRMAENVSYSAPHERGFQLLHALLAIDSVDM